MREFLGHNPDAQPSPFQMYPRTPAHAATRILGKWHRVGGPVRAAKGYRGADAIQRPAGYLAELLFEQACELPACEMGVLLDTGAECQQCRYRETERIQTAHAHWVLAEQRAERERLSAEAAVRRQAEIDAVYDEAAEENVRRDAVRAARAAEALETARLREELAAQHPELVSVGADVPGPRDGAGRYAEAAGRGRQAAEEQRVRAALVATGAYGSPLEEEVRRRMRVWKAERRGEAQAADLAAVAARPVGAWPTDGHAQDTEPPF
ncbi:hypothetical protein ACTVZO_43375 [Streptomyces sp. IBSNAI002]|uniref:hypothetical protein n=1 Tax=Streptomyces sp. IBSNAI002 TaxID=3457500 RepID=UPI003FD3D670